MLPARYRGRSAQRLAVRGRFAVRDPTPRPRHPPAPPTSHASPANIAVERPFSGCALCIRSCGIVGYRHGYFSEEESPQVAAAIRDSRARILFVAISSPRKERWLGEHGPTLNVPFAMGVGGSIDVVAGITRRAPPAWQRLGIEWLYRLIQEPQRMLRRYLVTNVQFSAMVARALLLRAASLPAALV